MADYDLGTARGKIEIDASTLGRTSAAFDKFGKTMFGVGALALAGFGIAVGAAASFEKTMSGVEAVLAPTQTEMDKLRELTLRLGKDTIFSSKEVAEGMEAMAKAGLSVDEILGGAAEASTNLAAAAGDMKLDRAAEIASNAMRMFGLSAGDLNYVADSLAGAANASTVEVDDLAVSLKYAGSVANAMGVPFRDVNTALAILGDRGIRGSTAGTSLRGVLLSLTGTSGPAKEALKDLGIITEDGSNKFFDAAGNMKSLAEVSQILGDATKHLSEEQRTAAFNTIFQRRAMASALILADQGAAGFARYTAEIEKVSAADVAAKKLDNLAGDVEILKGSIETLVIQFGQTFQDMLRGWVQRITDVVNWVASWDEGTQKLAMQVLFFGGILATSIGTFVLFMGAMVKTYRAAMDFYRGMKLVWGVMKLVTTSIWAQNAAWLANPIVAIVAAIVAFYVALFIAYKKIEPFRKAVDALAKKLGGMGYLLLGLVSPILLVIGQLYRFRGAIGDVVGWIRRNWDMLLPIFLGPIGAIILVWRRFGDDIKNIISSAITAVVGFFMALPGRLLGIFLTIVGAAATFAKNFATSLIDGIGNAINSFQEFMSKLPYWAGYYIGLVLGMLVRFGIDAVSTIATLGVDFIQAYVDFLVNLPGKVWEFLVMVVQKITDFGVAGVGKAQEFGTNFVNKIVEFLTQLPGRVWGFLTQVVAKVQQLVTEGIPKAIAFGKGVLDKIVEFVSQLPGKMAGFVGDMIGKITGAIGDAGVAAGNMARRIKDTFLNIVEGLPGTVAGIFNKIVQAIKDKISSAFNAVKDFASGMWEGFKKGLFGSPRTKIEYAVEDMTDTVDRETKTLIGQVRQIQALSNQIGDLNPQANLGMATGSGVIGFPRTTAPAAAPTAGTTREGDTFIINGADQKTAQEISREIIFDKRVTVG